MKKTAQSTKEYSYTVMFEPVKGGFQATVPSLQGLVTFGRSLKEAKEMAQDAMICHIKSLKKDRKRIPTEKSLLRERLVVSV